METPETPITSMTIRIVLHDAVVASSLVLIEESEEDICKWLGADEVELLEMSWTHEEEETDGDA